MNSMKNVVNIITTFVFSIVPAGFIVNAYATTATATAPIASGGQSDSVTRVVSAPVSDLLTIYHLALKNDMTLASARASYKANLENTPLARSALLPQLGLTASTSWNKQVNNLSATDNQVKNSSESRTFGWNDHQWGASLTQPVFDAGAWFDLKAAKAQNVQDLAVFNIAQQDLIMRVAKSYFNVLHLEDTVATTEAEQRAVKRQMAQAEERYKVGLLPQADVEEAKASYDAVVVKVIEAKNQVNLAYKQLTTITGHSIHQLAPLGVKIQLSKPEPAEPSAWVKQSVANNLSMKAARAGVNVSQLQLQSAKSALLPSVSASVSYAHDSANTWRKLNKADNTTYSLSVSVPIFTGGKNSAQIKQNSFNLESSQYLEELQQRTVSQDALSFYDSVNADISKVGAACQGVISAGVALKVTDSGYHAGIRTIMDVLQSQQNLHSAQQAYFNSRYGYIIDTLKLKQAAGTLSPADLVQLNQMLNKKIGVHEHGVDGALSVCKSLTHD